jgi:hypothetical protein
MFCFSLTSLRGIEGMPLTHLACADTPVSDLSPLAGMKLKEFVFTPKNITKGIEIVRGMKSIREIGPRYSRLMDPEVFWKKYDAGEFNK